MRIIEPSVELVGGNVGLFDRPKHVELCGRVCYKSESKITEDSAEKFIAGIIKRGHEAVLEHARITLNLSNNRDTWRMLNQMCGYMQISSRILLNGCGPKMLLSSRNTLKKNRISRTRSQISTRTRIPQLLKIRPSA